jgi:hypothetical protein
MSFIRKNYVKFRGGAENPYVLLDALHAAPESERREFFTDEIADSVSSRTGCHCIIATVPREVADLNQCPYRRNWEATQEYRGTIRDLLLESEALDENSRLRFPFLHLSLHGMRNRPNKDVELGTYFGKSCSDQHLQWLLDHFRKWAKDLSNGQQEPEIVDNDPNDVLWGHPVISTHRRGDERSGYAGYGPKYNTVQIELAHWLRNEHKKEIIELLTRVAEEFREISVGNVPG